MILKFFFSTNWIVFWQYDPLGSPVVWFTQKRKSQPCCSQKRFHSGNFTVTWAQRASWDRTRLWRKNKGGASSSEQRPEREKQHVVEILCEGGCISPVKAAWCVDMQHLVADSINIVLRWSALWRLRLRFPGLSVWTQHVSLCLSLCLCGFSPRSPASSVV